MNIYISNLGFNVKSEDLKKKFLLYGDVNAINLIVDKITNCNHGYALISMDDKAAAQNAIRELNGYMLDGRSIKVQESGHINERPGNNFY
jgi:RNA recognition motif-containing protein